MAAGRGTGGSIALAGCQTREVRLLPGKLCSRPSHAGRHVHDPGELHSKQAPDLAIAGRLEPRTFAVGEQLAVAEAAVVIKPTINGVQRMTAVA
jgi:hypothetical protein